MVMMNDDIRDELGAVAREAQMKWASTYRVGQPESDDIRFFEHLDEDEKECYRKMAEAVVTKLALMSLNQQFQEDLTMGYRIEEV